MIELGWHVFRRRRQTYRKMGADIENITTRMTKNEEEWHHGPLPSRPLTGSPHLCGGDPENCSLKVMSSPLGGWWQQLGEGVALAAAAWATATP